MDLHTFYTNIENQTISNKFYRNVKYTDDNIQIVLMNLQPGEDIPEEKHNGTQFIRIESGKGLAMVSGKSYNLHDGVSITIPKMTKHYIKNISNTPLTLYSIYSPPEHPKKLVQYEQP